MACVQGQASAVLLHQLAAEIISRNLSWTPTSMEQDVAAALEAEALSYHQEQSKAECRLRRELGAAEAHPMIS